MAVKCPNCGRPNPGETPKCIYCGAELPHLESARPASKGESEEKAGPAPGKIPGAVSKERILLLVSPLGQEPGKEMVKGFGRLMGWDDYTSRLKLRSPVPFILSAYDDAAELQDLIKKLKETGLDSCLVKESGLTRLEKKYLAKTASADESGIIFELEDGSSKAPAFEDLFLMVRGRIRLGGEIQARVGATELSELEMDREKFFDLIIKFRRDRKQRKAEIGELLPGEASTEVEVFDLYAQKEHTAVRVIESEFDFAKLFGLQARLLGFKKLVELLRKSAPEMMVDESFNKTGYTFREKPVDKKQALRLAQSGKTRSREKLHSSQAHFTEHSGLIYLYYLGQKRGE